MERGILSGGTDQGQQATLDMGQKAILLGLVETVDFIDEEDGLPAILVSNRLTLLDNPADVLDPGEHGRKEDKVGLTQPGQQSGQGGLAGARWASEQERRQVARLNQSPENFVLAHQMLLTDILGKGLWTHPFG